MGVGAVRHLPDRRSVFAQSLRRNGDPADYPAGPEVGSDEPPDLASALAAVAARSLSRHMSCRIADRLIGPMPARVVAPRHARPAAATCRATPATRRLERACSVLRRPVMPNWKTVCL